MAKISTDPGAVGSPQEIHLRRAHVPAGQREHRSGRRAAASCFACQPHVPLSPCGDIVRPPSEAWRLISEKVGRNLAWAFDQHALAKLPCLSAKSRYVIV